MKPSLLGFAFLVLTLPTLQAQAPLASGEENSTSTEKPSLADWPGLREAFDRARHGYEEVEEGHRAFNGAQHLQFEFDGRGFRTASLSEVFGLELESYGFDLSEQRVQRPADVSVDERRLTYRWNDQLEEWFVNGESGLEHGFTLKERPAGHSDDRHEPLAFTMNLRGPLTPKLAANGRGVSLLGKNGQVVLRYSGLTVFDATGAELEAWLTAEGNVLRIFIEENDAAYPLTIDPVVQQGYLKASSPGVQDQFGGAVAASGDTVVVGAGFEDSNATGVNGDSSNNSSSGSGAAYVFVRSGSTWTQEAYLKASNAGSNDGFGRSVAISGDTIVVGALFERSNATGVNGDQSNNSAVSSGAAYVFNRSSGSWSQEAYLKASNTDSGDRYGISVAIDGDTIAVGAIFEASNADGVNGDEANNSKPNSGAAYVYQRDGATWSQQAYLKAHEPDELDRFGVSVAVSGDTVVVGAMTEGSAATGVNGDFTDNSSSQAGAAYVFFRTGSTWAPQAYLKASNTGSVDYFGREVAISGDRIVVGAPFEDSDAVGPGGDQSNNSRINSGAVYVFERSAGVWGQVSYLKSPAPDAHDSFGSGVGISGELILVGVDAESSEAAGVNGDPTDNSAVRSGAGFVFAPCGSEWGVAAYLKAVNPDPEDSFGRKVAISGDTVILAAHRESSDASGVDGDPFNNLSLETGAAYVFDLDTPILQFCGFPDYCNGDGGDQMGCSDCPCSNNAAPGTIGGCLNSNADSARLLATGDPSISLTAGSTTDLRFAMEGAMPSVFSALFSGSSLAPVSPSQPCFGLNSGAQSPAFDGLRCASLSVLRHGNRGTDANGAVGVTTAPWGGEGAPLDGIAQAGAGFAAGQVRYFQVVYRDDPALSCMTGLNTTQAIEVTFTP